MSIRSAGWLRTHRGWLFAAIFLLGAGARAIDLWRPVDGRVRDSWRECDEAAIARNFAREGMNILYPRIDWRGDGPGYAEMEFPLFPWSIAALYKVFGFHEVLGRLLAYTLALATLAVFLALASMLLPWRGAAAAGLFFAVSPLAIRVSNALQPESLMLLAYVTAAYAFVRWLKARDANEPALAWYLTAACATALAVLAKATAANVGVLFLVLLWRRQGRAMFRDPQVWAFGIIALVPAILWYHHAHHLWLLYGNSLGLSNEDHWIGLDVFRNPDFVGGLVTSELYYVWMPAGVIVAAYGLLRAPRAPAARIAVPLMIGAVLLYIAAIRTTAAFWALYYHVFSTIPVALLFGLGVAQLVRVRWTAGTRAWAATATVVAGLSMVVFAKRDIPFGFGTSRFVVWAVTGLLAGFAVLIVMERRRRPASSQTSLTFLAAAGAAPATFALLAGQVIADIHPHPEMQAYRAAVAFAPLVAPGTLILSSGGPCSSPLAPRVAYNASYMFYWLDRKGFDICTEAQMPERVDGFAKRGARYFVANNATVGSRPGFEAAISQRYRLMASSNGWSLYDLQAPVPNAQ